MKIKLQTMEQISQAWPDMVMKLQEDPKMFAAEFAEVAYKTLLTRPPAIIATQSEDDKKEIIQEIVIHFVSDNCRTLRKYEDTNHQFLSWFYTVAFRKAVDFVRKDKKYQSCEEISDSTVTSVGNPEVNYQRKEAADIARQIISRMTDKCRILFRAIAQGYSYKEITVLLGLPADQNKKVADDLRACRNRFMKLLEDQGISTEELARYA